MDSRTSARMPRQIEKTGMRALSESFGILGTCIKEAPEFASRAEARRAP